MRPRPLDRTGIRALIAFGEHSLAEGPLPERARFDAEALLLHILRREVQERNRAWLIAHADSPTMPGVAQEFRALIERRYQGEPIQYIIGETEFYGRPFRVTPDVLIPRPETEHLVEKVIELAVLFQSPRIVDIGTGSGAILLALLSELPNAYGVATDISLAALKTAKNNAAKLGLADRAGFVACDYASALSDSFDLIVSNPPYIPTADITALDIEVRAHDPLRALDGGPDGLDAYRLIAPAAARLLTPGGLLVVEVGHDQSDDVASLMVTAGLTLQGPAKADLAGIQRAVLGRK